MLLLLTVITIIDLSGCITDDDDVGNPTDKLGEIGKESDTALKLFFYRGAG